MSVAKHMAYSLMFMFPLYTVGGNSAAETRFQMHVAETRVQLCIVILQNGLAWHKKESYIELNLESGFMIADSFVLYLQ